MKVHVLPVFLGITALVNMGGCAAIYTDAQKSPERNALVKTTCTSVMRVRTNDEMLACVNSLSDMLSAALAAKTQAALDMKADKGCTDKGLAYGTPAFSLCVLGNQQAYTAEFSRTNAVAGNPPVMIAFTPDRNENDRWDFDGRHGREEYSCAQLGLDPTSTIFAGCVSDLESAMQLADDPALN